MSEMKYVMFKMTHDNSGLEKLVPVIFPTLLVHEDVAKKVSGVEPLSNKAFTTDVSSAGFIRLDTLECYGESGTLNVGSQPERDSLVIRTYSYMNGLLT